MSTDEIRLTLPAMPDYARIARLTAAGLATRVGFDYDEVEDLRIAVGEACSLLLGTGGGGTMTFVYRLSEGAIEIEATGDATVTEATEEQSALSDQILGAVVDEYGVDRARGIVRLRKAR